MHGRSLGKRIVRCCFARTSSCTWISARGAAPVTRVCNPCVRFANDGRFKLPLSPARVKNPCHDDVARTTEITMRQTDHHQTPSRRQALKTFANGFGMLGLAGLFANESF